MLLNERTVEMINILHIAAHLGGGAGKAIMGLAIQCKKCRNQEKELEQRIILLEEPEKKIYVEQGRGENIPIFFLSQDRKQLPPLLEWADIVVVNWWNHPVMAKVLAEWPQIPCRVVLWCHVNGCVYPYLPYDFANCFERVFITTEYTLKNPLWEEKERLFLQRKTCLLHGMGEFYPEEILSKQNYQMGEMFLVGYVGTVNYSKLHPQYLSYCQEAIKRIPKIHFLIVGEAEEEIVKEVERRGLSSYFSFVGYVEDLYPYYRQMDVLGYLLKEDNYATTENVLLEAMAVGLPVIAYQNPPEEHILTENRTGFLIKGKEEYVTLLQRLYDSEDLRRSVGQRGRAYVIENYSSEKNCQNFLEEITKVWEKERVLYSFQTHMGNSPYEWFCCYTGYEKDMFRKIETYSEIEIRNFLERCPSIYRERSKGSILHFAKYYPEDKMLKKLEKEIKERKEVKQLEGSTPGGVRECLACALPLEMPYLIQIFPVYACNFRCGYCIYSLDRKQHGYISNETFLPMELFCKIVDDVKRTGKKLKMLRFAAIGEPLLHPEIAEMVAYAKRNEIADSIDIVTNASLLTNEVSDKLINAGLSRLRISLEGLSDEDYRRHSSVSLNFENLVENIRYFYEHTKETKIYIKIIDYMVQEKKKRETFREIFAPIAHEIAVEHLTPTISEIDYDRLSEGMKMDKPQNGDVLQNSQICSQPFYMMQINPDGNVVPCCSMKYPCVLGTVKAETVEEIWKGKAYNQFRRELLNGVKSMDRKVCSECKLYLYDMHQEDRLDEEAERLRELYRDF